MTKGQEVYIEGRLETRKYTDKNGVDRWRTEIIADNMQLGSKPKDSYNKSASTYNQSSAPAPAKETPGEEIPTINLDEEEEIKIEDVPF